MGWGEFTLPKIVGTEFFLKIMKIIYMRKAWMVLFSLALAMAPVVANAQQETASKSIDEQINDFVKPATDGIFQVIFFPVTIGDHKIPFILIWLLGAGVFLTLSFKFINLRAFKLAFRTAGGRYSSPDDPGEITHFRALATALSATVGLGNIAGVAIAIAKGGPGATFWMILVGFLGMTVKFAECTLGVKYRLIGEDGRVFGGPMRYLSEGLKERKLAPLGRTLAVVFALLCVGASLGGGNMFQVNQAVQQVVNVTGGDATFLGRNEWLLGLGLAVLVGIVIIGGIVRIATVTSKLVPVMCGIYVIAALGVIFTNLGEVPRALTAIIEGAFNPQAIEGGMIGVLLVGIQRAVFSNEAGIGSAPIAHSAVKTRYPASEGIVALLEPFVDTVVVCTMTALVIVITGVYDPSMAAGGTAQGIEMTSDAFATVIGWFPYVLLLAVLCFAFSTLISWSYYGTQAWMYLFGRSRASEMTYKVIFCVFVVIGAAMTLGAVTDFSDGMLLGMCFPNLLGVYILLPVVKRELRSYLDYTKDKE